MRPIRLPTRFVHKLLPALLLAFSMGTHAETPAERADQAIDDIRTFKLVSRNQAAVARIERIFSQVQRAARSYRPGAGPQFQVLVTNTPEYAHAESHANGVIVVTEAFAAFSDANLAFVLAHELAHEELDHPRTQALLSDEIRGQESPASFQLRVIFGMLPVEVTDRLRSDEISADATACLWLQRTPYRFDGAAFFRRMEAEPSASPQGSATHPSYQQRVENLRTLGCASGTGG